MKTLMKKILFAAIICLLNTHLSAQEGNFWHFGNNASINFNNPGSPVVGPSSFISTYSAGSTDEGVAAISNSLGQLLFYTDGQNSYSANGAPMPNGSGLMGHRSSTQSGIIIPKPGSSTQYFIFTVDAFAGPNTIRYNIVDMNLNSNNGDIITTKKNLPMPYALAAPTAFAERMIAIPKSGSVGYWLIAHLAKESSTTGTFVVWDITCNSTNDGISEVLFNGQRQSIGSTCTSSIYASELGYMKISPNGSSLAYASTGNNIVEVFNFNNSSGAISNARKITSATLGSGCKPYGIEYSPNNQYLFVTDLYSFKVYQYNLNNLNLDISTSVISKTYTPTGSQTAWPTYYTQGALQYAPDGNIYCALPGRNHLMKITNPNSTGWLVTENGLSLSSVTNAYCGAGLPNFVASFVGTASINVAISPCAVTVGYSAASNLPNATYLWDFGDGATSTLQNPTHYYSSAGTYIITMTVSSGGCSITKKISVQVVTCGGCQANTDPSYVKYMTNATISNNTVWGSKIYIHDNVIITVDNGAALDITNSDVVFGRGAGINITNGSILRANNSVFRPCNMNDVWRSIAFFTNNGVPPIATINENTFKNAKTALEIYSTSSNKMNADIRITNNLFAACQRGLNMQKVVFKRSFTGNTYMIDNQKLPFNTVSSLLTSSSNKDFYGIWANVVDFTDVIAQNDFVFTGPTNPVIASGPNSRSAGIYIWTSKKANIIGNKMTDFICGVYANYSDSIAVENNTMEWSKQYNMASAAGNKVQILINYSDVVTIKGNKIYTSNTMNANSTNLSNLTISNIGISSNGSQRVIVSQNQINGCELGMSFNGSGGSSSLKDYLFIVENDIIKPWYYGIYVADYRKVDITCNKVDMELNTTRDATGVAYYANNTSIQDIAVRNNCIFNSKTALYCYSANPSSNISLPKFYNNFAYNYRQCGFENNGFAATATGSPREIFHNTFLSNNSLSGIADVYTDPSHIINIEANYGVQNTNTNVNITLANANASTASCAAEVINIANNITGYNNAFLCSYYFPTSGPTPWNPLHKVDNSNEVPYDVFPIDLYIQEPIHTRALPIISCSQQLFQVYPNPAQNEVTISYNLEKASNAQLELLDIQGRVLKSFNISFEHTSLNIGIEDLKKGVYFFRLTNADQSVYHAKCIKE